MARIVKFSKKSQKLKNFGLKTGWSILILVFLITTFYGIGIYKFNWSRYGAKSIIKIIPYPACFVGPYVITMAEFQKQKDFIYFISQKTESALPEERKLNQEILDKMIEIKLAEITLKKHHIYISQKEVEEEYQKILQQQDEESFKKMLKAVYGIGPDDLKAMIRQKKIIEKLKNEILVSVHAYHILKKVPQGVDNKYFGDRAWEILNQIKAGASFEEMAQKYSDDEATKDKSGDLGWLQRGSVINNQPMSKEFENGLFSLNPGEISNPVLTEFGWHIFKITEKRGMIDKSYSDWLAEERDKTKIIKFIGK